MFSDEINIGYSPDVLIPENNAVNLKVIVNSLRIRRGGFEYIPILSCFTTQGYENPVWIISNNEFSTGSLNNNGTVTLPGGDITITIINISIYHSQIYIDAADTNFTGNLICQSQNNPGVQYRIIITTSMYAIVFHLHIHVMNIIIIMCTKVSCFCICVFFHVL